MVLTEFDEQKYTDMIRAEGKAEGLAEMLVKAVELFSLFRTPSTSKNMIFIYSSPSYPIYVYYVLLHTKDILHSGM